MSRNKAETTEAREAVIYVRVSTTEQELSGLGLADQEARCRGYCAAQGWTVTGVYSDGVSGKTLDRPELARALEALPRHGVLVALKLDRLTRSVADLAPLAERIAAKGADWVAVAENYDTSTATGRLMLRMVLELSQWEREIIAERTVAALQAKRSRLERLGTTPLGFRTDAEGRVTADPEGQETVARARELRQAGLTLQSIADRLHHEGRRTGRGGRWRTETVRRLLAVRYLERVVAHQNANGAVRGDNAAA